MLGKSDRGGRVVGSITADNHWASTAATFQVTINGQTNMALSEIYKDIKGSIVGFYPIFAVKHKDDAPSPPIPPIFGTGFVVADGIVATNHHILETIYKCPTPPNYSKDLWPAQAILFYDVPGKGIAQVPLEIKGACEIEHDVNGTYYGPDRPDLAFIQVNMKGLPSIKLNDDPQLFEEGKRVATAGFPMGSDALMAPGYLHQINTMLQEGIVSAVLPFPCNKPHAFIANIMTQGGASGSPVFTTENGDVVGMIYAGLEDPNLTPSTKDLASHRHAYVVPTAFSYVVPAHNIIKALAGARELPELKLSEDAPDLKALVEKSNFVIIKSTQKEKLWDPEIIIETAREKHKPKVTKIKNTY